MKEERPLFPTLDLLYRDTDKAHYVERLLREVYEDLGPAGAGVNKQTWSSVRNLASLYWGV